MAGATQPIVAVGLLPFDGDLLSILNGFKNLEVKQFVRDRPVVALDIIVLLRLAGLDVGQGDVLFLGPDQQRCSDVFGAIVDVDHQSLTAPFDDLTQGSGDQFLPRLAAPAECVQTFTPKRGLSLRNPRSSVPAPLPNPD